MGVRVLDVPGIIWGLLYVVGVDDVDRVNGKCWWAGGGCSADDDELRRDSLDSSSPHDGFVGMAGVTKQIKN